MGKYVHYIFSTYKRAQILEDCIADYLSVLFDEICREKGFRLIAHNILLDHVHLLIEKNELDRNEYVMKSLKAISARRLFDRFPTDRFVFRKLWGRGYRAYEVEGDEETEKVLNYIKNQKINGIDKRYLLKPGNREVHSQVSWNNQEVTKCNNN